MQGPNDPPELKGVIPNSFSHIFDFVKASTGVEFLVRCSYLEIYNEVVRYGLVSLNDSLEMSSLQVDCTGICWLITS